MWVVQLALNKSVGVSLEGKKPLGTELKLRETFWWGRLDFPVRSNSKPINKMRVLKCAGELFHGQ